VEKHFIKINNKLVSYYDLGKGEPLLIIHGWFSTKEHFLPVIKELKTSHRIIVPDLPGFGESESIQPPIRLTKFLNFINKFTSQLNLYQFSIFGNSLGGTISLLLVLAQPEQIKKIILRTPLYTYKSLPPMLINNYAYKTLKQSTKKNLIQRLLGFIIQKSLFHLMIKNKLEENNEEVLQKLKPLFKTKITKNFDLDVMRAVIFEVMRLDISDKLKQIKQPVLLIWGKNDKLNRYFAANQLKKELPHCKLISTSGAHSLFSDNWTDLSSTMNQFLKTK
jgi:pimeloyl-ACP methyl ester carboxylesterase